MNEVIFSHVADNRISVLFSGSKRQCLEYVAQMKRDAKKNNFAVWGWCNDGFCVPKLYSVEIR